MLRTNADTVGHIIFHNLPFALNERRAKRLRSTFKLLLNASICNTFRSLLLSVDYFSSSRPIEHFELRLCHALHSNYFNSLLIQSTKVSLKKKCSLTIASTLFNVQNDVRLSRLNIAEIQLRLDSIN